MLKAYAKAILRQKTVFKGRVDWLRKVIPYLEFSFMTIVTQGRLTFTTQDYCHPLLFLAV